MRYRFLRTAWAAGLLTVSATGAVTLAVGPKTRPQRCPQPACTTPCDPTTQGLVYCMEGKDGVPFASTFECCCCNAEAKHRYYVGPK